MTVLSKSNVGTTPTSLIAGFASTRVAQIIRRWWRWIFASALRSKAAKGGLVGLVLFIVYYRIRVVHHPELHYNLSKPWLRELVDSIKTLHEPYYPTPWCFNPHLQIFVMLIRHALSRKPHFRRQLIVHEDGGETGINWNVADDNLPVNAPIVVYLHSIMGDRMPPPLADLIASKGWRTAVMIRRGHGGIALKTARWNTLGDTSDLRDSLQEVQKQFPDAPMVLIGLSAGCGTAVRYLGEEAERTPFVATAILSPGWAFRDAIRCVHPFYDAFLTRQLKNFFLVQHKDVLEQYPAYDHCMEAENVVEFHERCATLCGFETPDEFFKKTCPMEVAMDTSIPYLLLNSFDDPICSAENIDFSKVYRNGNGVLVTVDRGSHCTFWEGMFAQSWMARLTVDFLEQTLAAHAAKKIPFPLKRDAVTTQPPPSA